MSSFNLNSLIRDNILKIDPYLSAREEYSKKGNEYILLDANENSFGAPLSFSNSYNRYPDPLQMELKRKISEIKKISPSKIFLGNGSDEIIDLIYRIFSRPNRDHSIIFPPTYGMYEVSGKIHGVDIVKVLLTEENYQLNLKKIKEVINPYSRIIFICSPNNPTGNNLKRKDIQKIIKKFTGVVVLDEAYIDFSEQESFSVEIEKYPNLIILQTLSKSWGLAGLRIGIAITSEDIIQWMNKVKFPYNISKISQKIAIQALENKDLFFYHLKNILSERKYMEEALNKIPIIQKVYPSSSNFLLVKVSFPSRKIYKYLVEKNVIVRDRSKIILCDECLRITIGTHEENEYLINQMKKYSEKFIIK
ncbi:histidinol-phosphate aminotransferase [Blattabacterium sp. (Mastotermes darwiniensis) str. MADAR]|uniref:histidinol-phosphate transaminase n=1 Tax=Blattabacterium sp. (Mastotermes darwiniensis) TaxID=39768 RepID=UPI000231DFC3|nr:histidinol-phosphate transaminase [Blattabacterium sp. (Mastotermes darwiniensis)]AER40475.1 histidinol-phosphate aminotransferase [Blattabacterium sp. (Mastotermes darwiniensis) str. MADAR]